MVPSAQDVDEAIIRALSDTLGEAAMDLDRDADLRQLGLDSLDFTAVLLAVEDDLGIEVPIEAVDELVDGGEGVVSLARIAPTLVRWLSPPQGAPR